MNLCHDCIEERAVAVDKGTPVCQKCYGRRYSKKNKINALEKQPTIYDLKRKWERKW